MVLASLPLSLVVAGTTSGVGKTTVSLAIMYSLKDRMGYNVQPFKVGPDFIDPTYHNIVTGNQSKNLDAWMMGKGGIIRSVFDASEGVDIAVIEGVMGLYDGLSGKTDFASTAYVAKVLDAQVILIIDAGRAARSVAAMAMGYIQFDKAVNIAGIILNNVAGEKHAQYIREAFEQKLKIPIIGIIRRDKELRLRERHLGLIPTDELDRKMKGKVLDIARSVADEISFDALLKIIENQKKFKQLKLPKEGTKKAVTKPTQPNKIRIAVALDNSFNFYYAENLGVLQELGAEICYFSPIQDKKIPDDVSGVMIGGGFPEVMADKLSANGSMRKYLAKLAEDDMPFYAECGGLMYLTKSIYGYTKSPKSFKMVGIVDAVTNMVGKLTLNYTQADVLDNKYGKIANLRGHEFHYSRIEDAAKDLRYAYDMRRGYGINGKKDGVSIYNCLASYMHLHFSDHRFPKKWIDRCKEYAKA
ncbi:MAG: cobyrinate a,c-diamide synthase [Nitrososphaeraceae archaeon]